MDREASPCYCINLRRAANAVSAMYDAHLEPLGLTVNQFSLLKSIERMETCSVTRLSEASGLDRTTLVRTLQPLLDRGLIRDLPGSGRARNLHLTEDGLRAATEGMPYWRAAQREVAARAGDTDIRALMNVLARLEG